MSGVTETIFFNKYVSDVVSMKPGVSPEKILLDIFYRDCMTLSLKLAKEIFIFRDSLEIAKVKKNVLPNGLNLTADMEKRILQEAEAAWKSLTILRSFMCAFYNIPQPREGIRMQNEFEDDIEEMRGNVRILDCDSEEDIIAFMKEEQEKVKLNH